MIKKFTLFMVCAICALVANAQTGSGIYLRGEVNGWSDDETVMQDCNSQKSKKASTSYKTNQYTARSKSATSVGQNTTMEAMALFL